MASIIWPLFLMFGALFSASKTQALQCQQNDFTYGGNEIVDELLSCSLSSSLDLDLTPHGDRIKATSRTLVDQGLSNKTTILHTKLSGLWTARRPRFVETGWKCSSEEVISTSIIELNNLSLEVIERLDMPLHRNQHMLATHRPCKTFELPVWMCRSSKPIYRTTSTWVNRAYLNLTLAQRLGESSRPVIRKLAPMFTCPETFKQRVTHSPSASYMLTRHMQQTNSQPYEHPMRSGEPSTSKVRRNNPEPRSLKHLTRPLDEPHSTISHPSSFSTLNSGKMPAAPSYHNSVALIMEHVTKMLGLSIGDCIGLIESDLSLMADHNSFSSAKYSLDELTELQDDDTRQGAINQQSDDARNNNFKNECSNRAWTRTRIELANQVSSLADAPHHQPPTKRNQFQDPQMPSSDQLLDPNAHYNHQDEQMIEDTFDL